MTSKINNKVKKMKNNSILILLGIFAIFQSCKSDNAKADAYGNFEAIETIISAEANGKLLEFKINEGEQITADSYVGQIDTIQLHYQRIQLNSKKAAIQTGFRSVVSQIDVIEEQLATLEKEKLRVQKLIDGKAATQKQMDDIVGQMNVLKKQMETVKSQNASLFAEIDVISASIEQLDDQISRARITNPILGTVLEKYAEQFEIVFSGKPLYKIANLSELILRAYVSGDQLDDIKIGQKVKVEIDKDTKENHTYEGIITWISSESEFTPKVIQTKEERVNMVYAVKIKVVNDGKIKIGMPGEVRF